MSAHPITNGVDATEDEPPPSPSPHPSKQSSASKRRQRKKNLVQNQRHGHGHVITRVTKPIISQHVHVTSHDDVDVHGIVQSPRSHSSSGSSNASSPVSTTSSIASSVATSPSYAAQQQQHTWNNHATTLTQQQQQQQSQQQTHQSQQQQQPLLHTHTPPPQQQSYRYHPFPMTFYPMIPQHVMIPSTTLPLPHPMIMPWYTPQQTNNTPSTPLGYSRSWNGLPPPAMTSPTRAYVMSTSNGHTTTQTSPQHMSSPFTTPTKSPSPAPENITQPSIIKHKHTNISPPSHKLTSQPYDFYCILDFEATCEQNEQYYQHEIIEFPVVFVNSKTLQIDYEFHSYVRPVLHPELTPFCTRLTGIQQSDVATAPTLQSVIQSFEQFCLSHNFYFPGQRSLQKSHRHTYSSVCTTSTQPPQPIQQHDDIMVNNRGPNAKSCCFVTDGPWDFLSFLEPECALKQLPLSPIYHHFIDLRQMFSSFYACKRTGIKGMLQRIGMTFQGREHSGLADSRNIARIAIHLLQQGCLLTTNLSIYP